MKIIQFIIIGFLSLLLSCQSTPPVETEHVGKDQGKNQNAVIATIMNRRSIRSYKSEQIKQEELDLILQCGINAPSARNTQPWAIRVVQSKELLKKINTDYINYIEHQNPDISNRIPNYDVLFGAPTFILIAGDTTEMYAHNDCGMLAQNMLLAAESMQIGSCVLGGIIRFFNAPQGDEIRSMLNLPENHRLFIGVVLGYKNETPDAKPRDPLKIQKIL